MDTVAMFAIMRQCEVCVKASSRLFKKLRHNKDFKNLNLELPDEHGKHYAFCAKVLADNVEESGQLIIKISISIPPDAMGNRGPQAPYHENEIPETIETALINTDGEILHDEIQRFGNTQDLIIYLENVVGKKV